MGNNSYFAKRLVLGKLTINILISFIIFLVFIGLIEAILRTTHVFNAKTPWIKPDPILGFRYIPGSNDWHFFENDHPITGRINRYGWRDKEWLLNKPQHVYRVAVLGDSMVASLDVESDRSFLALTEDQLNKSSQQYTFELMNFGLSNISQAEEYLILKNDIIQFSPDIVLLFFFPGNDLHDMNRETASHVKRPFYNISKDGELLLDTSFTEGRYYVIRHGFNLVKQHSALINLIGERYASYKEYRRNKAVNLSGKHGKEHLPGYLSLCTTNPDPIFTKNYRLNKILIKEMAKYCKDREINFMLVTVNIPDIYKPEDEKKYASIDPTFNANFFEDDMQEYAKSLGIEYLGLQKIFRQVYEKTGISLHWSHWNYEGHKVVADILSKKLRTILDKTNVATENSKVTVKN